MKLLVVHLIIQESHLHSPDFSTPPPHKLTSSSSTHLHAFQPFPSTPNLTQILIPHICTSNTHCIYRVMLRQPIRIPLGNRTQNACALIRCATGASVCCSRLRIQCRIGTVSELQYPADTVIQTITTTEL